MIHRLPYRREAERAASAGPLQVRRAAAFGSEVLQVLLEVSERERHANTDSERNLWRPLEGRTGVAAVGAGALAERARGAPTDGAPLITS